MKAIRRFRTESEAMEMNLQYILSENHESRYNVYYFDIMISEFTHPFILKEGDGKNYHTNDKIRNYDLIDVY